MAEPIRISPETQKRLERIARETKRSSDKLIKEALEIFLLDYEKRADWKAAGADIAAGRFASPEEVERVFAKAERWQNSDG